MILIGVINNAGNLGKELIISWVNTLARNIPTRFLHGTDRIYFESLIRLLKRDVLPARLNYVLDLLPLKKKLIIVEIYPENLFVDDKTINEDKINLVESHALLYISKSSLTVPDKIIRLVLKKKGRRRFIKKVVREPFALVIKYDGIVTPSYLEFLKSRFRQYEIFRVEEQVRNGIMDYEEGNHIKPILWLFNKLIGLTFVSSL